MAKQIMMVDDNPGNLTVYELLLSKRGYDVVTVQDGMRALELVKEMRPDLFIIDVMMPDMNGIELCERLREMRAFATTPVLFLSAWNEQKIVEQSLAAGADDFIAKPVDAKTLVARITSILGGGDV